jgi:hypothetical protein
MRSQMSASGSGCSRRKSGMVVRSLWIAEKTQVRGDFTQAGSKPVIRLAVSECPFLGRVSKLAPAASDGSLRVPKRTQESYPSHVYKVSKTRLKSGCGARCTVRDGIETNLLIERERIKRQTIDNRRLLHRQQAA